MQKEEQNSKEFAIFYEKNQELFLISSVMGFGKR